MMRWRRWLAGCLLATLPLGLSGCWDQIPLADRGSVLALYIQPARNHQLKWVFYFPNPSVTTGSIANVSTNQQFYTKTAVAPSIYEAYQDVESSDSRHVYLGQLEVMIFSQTLNSGQLHSVVDTYNRMGNWPNSVYMLSEPATVNPLPVTTHQPVPDLYYDSYFRCRTCHALSLATREWRVWDDIATPGVSAVMPYAPVPTRPEELIVFPHQHWGHPVLFNRAETTGWALLKNRANQLTLAVPTAEGRVVVKNIKARAKPSADLYNGRLKVTVHMRVTGNMVRWPTSVRLTPSQVAQYRSALTRRIIQLSLSAIGAADASQTDPFGWGRLYLIRHPGADIEIADRPGTVWPIDADVIVKAHLHVTGINS